MLIMVVGNGFFLSFLSLHLNQMDFPDSAIGLIHSAYYFGLLVGATKGEAIIHRAGHIQAYLAYACMGTACFMLQGLVFDPILWILLRFIAGFCLSVFYVVVESWLLHSVTVAARGVVLAIYLITLYAAQAGSQFILDWVNLASTQPFLLAGLLFALSGIPLALSKSGAPTFSEPSEHSMRSLFRVSYFGFIGCFISGMILSAIYSFAPIFAQERGSSVSGFMSACIFGAACLQWPIGKLSDITDRRWVLTGVSLLTGIWATLMTVLPLTPFSLYPWGFVLGGLCFTLYPLAKNQVCDPLPPNDLTKATGVLLLVYGVGAVLGPLAAPLFTEAYPEYGLFVYIVLNASILTLLGISSIRLKSKASSSKQARVAT